MLRESNDLVYVISLSSIVISELSSHQNERRERVCLYFMQRMSDVGNGRCFAAFLQLDSKAVFVTLRTVCALAIIGGSQVSQ